MKAEKFWFVLAFIGLSVAPAGAQDFLELPPMDFASLPIEYSGTPVSFLEHSVKQHQPSATPTAESPKCDEAASCAGRFYTQADALYWQRVGTGCNQVVAIDTDLTPGLDTVMTTGDLAFDFEPGARVLVGFYPDCNSRCVAWEFSYFGVWGWEDGKAVFGPGNLAIPGQLGLDSNNFFGADEIQMRDTSELNNAEINYVRTCCNCCNTQIAFLMGFRYINFHDRFELIGTDLQEGTSTYAIDATNNLYGFQMGGRLRHDCCRWSVELVGKAGIFLNDARQGQIVTDFPDTPDKFVLREASAHGNSAATVAELGITLIRRINDVWSVRVGYDVLGIGGLALAPDQLDFTDTFLSGTTLNKEGYAFFHGAHVGIEAGW